MDVSFGKAGIELSKDKFENVVSRAVSLRTSTREFY